MNYAAIDDGRGKYPEPLKIQAEIGTRQRVREAAQVEGVSIGEFVRRAIGERVERTREKRSTLAMAS